MKIIALGHKRRVGKTTGAKILQSHFRLSNPQLTCVNSSFSKNLKIVAKDIFGWAGIEDEQYYENYPEKRYIKLVKLNLHPVDLWIKLGMQIREINPDAWVNSLISKTVADILIISDLRFPNEAKVVRDYDGILIKINRKVAPVSDDVADNALNDWKDWDAEIDNDSDYKTYFNRLIEVAAS